MKTSIFHRLPILQDTSDPRGKPPKSNLALLAVVLLELLAGYVIFTGGTVITGFYPTHVSVEMIGKQK